jgi:hypothetical protein
MNRFEFLLSWTIIPFRTDLHKMKINTELCCKRYDFLTKKDPKLSLSELLSRITRIQIYSEFERVVLPWVRSNGPTDPLHISCICSIWKILHFYSSFTLNPSKSAFFHGISWTVGTNSRKCYASKLALKWQRFCLIGKPNMFFPSFLNCFSYFKNHMLFIVSKQCTCSRRVHIEGQGAHWVLNLGVQWGTIAVFSLTLYPCI